MAIHVDAAMEARFRNGMHREGITSEQEYLDHLMAVDDYHHAEIDDFVSGREDELSNTIELSLQQLDRGESISADESRARIAAMREREMKRTSEAV